MKKDILRQGFLALFLCCSSFFALWGQESSSYFYYYKGSRVYLTPDYTTISVSLRNDKALKNLEEVLRSNEKLQHSFNYNIFQFLQNTKDISSTKKEGTSIFYTEIHYSAPLNREGYQEVESRLNKISSLLMLSTGFVTDNGHKIGLSNNFYVKLRDSLDYGKLASLAEQNGIKILGKYKYRPLWHILSCDKDSKLNSLEAANLFYESNLFSHSEPEFIGHNLLQGSVSNDTYFSDQWYLKNTGQSGGVAGIDIRAEDAWCYSRGQGVKIAIFDTGIEKTHPDLAANIYGAGYDAQTGISSSDVYSYHGTAVAGIAGAVQNTEGITGVAPDSKLIPISVALNPSTTTPAMLTAGIDWAVSNGADVINNSWLWACPNGCLDDAISDAFSYGRGNKGTIIVFSSGNHNSSTSGYPANSNPLILNV